MLLTIIIELGIFLLTLLGWLLPVWQIPDKFVDAFSWALNLIFQWNGVLPVRSMFYILTVIITFEIMILLVRFIAGFISVIRGGGKVDV